MNVSRCFDFIPVCRFSGANSNSPSAVDWVQFEGRVRRNLDELYAGVCDGLRYAEIKEKYPEEFARRQEDKLTYRYPRGKIKVLHCFV